MKKKELSGKDLLLALLYCPGITQTENEPILGRTKITKMIYLFEKEIYPLFFKELAIDLPQFEPYHFGPFSKTLFEDLRFFLSIGLIETEETLIPISTADKYEFSISREEAQDDIWDVATFDDTDEEVELKYYLSNNGKNYVRDHVWDVFSQTQKDNLMKFKEKINSISLDALLNYVYNKYPDDAINSRISNKYLKEESGK